jgi:NADPH-dependent 2,4-dienoyl-CoA reductase/sulfur reductase-like enzyme
VNQGSVVKLRRTDRILVVGAGRAGVAALEEIRRSGHTGPLAVLHDETNAPYDRPGCAKGLLTGHSRPQDLRMPIADGLDVDWHLGRRAVFLDTAAQTVITDTDEAFEYDGLVVASGARAVAPPAIPVGEPGIHLIYGLDQAWALRADLHRAGRVAVVGAGLTGSEVAYAVRSMARECVLIDSKIPLTKPIGEHAARFIKPEMKRAGVELRIGRRVTEVYRARRGWALLLDDGEEVLADVIVASTGERPDTEWLAGTPEFDISDGVLCDQSLRVIGANNVVAAGTVARWPNLQYSPDPMRVGQWIAALEMGRAAAKTLLAGNRPVKPVTHLPRFWSDQFGLRIQVCGKLPPEADVAVTEMRVGRRDVARAGVLLGYQLDNRLVGLVGVNAPHAFTSMARAMIATGGAIAATPATVAAVTAPAEQAGRGRRYLAAVG